MQPTQDRYSNYQYLAGWLNELYCPNYPYGSISKRISCKKERLDSGYSGVEVKGPPDMMDKVICKLYSLQLVNQKEDSTEESDFSCSNASYSKWIGSSVVILKNSKTIRIFEIALCEELKLKMEAQRARLSAKL